MCTLLQQNIWQEKTKYSLYANHSYRFNFFEIWYIICFMFLARHSFTNSWIYEAKEFNYQRNLLQLFSNKEYLISMFKLHISYTIYLQMIHEGLWFQAQGVNFPLLDEKDFILSALNFKTYSWSLEQFFSQ